MIRAAALAAVLASGCSSSKDAPRPHRDAGEAAAPPPARTYSCKDVGDAWADYLHNGDRRSDGWAETARGQAGDCELNDWPQPERACWVLIDGAAAQQRCLDEHTNPRRDRTPQKRPDADPDDSIFSDDE